MREALQLSDQCTSMHPPVDRLRKERVVAGPLTGSELQSLDNHNSEDSEGKRKRDKIPLQNTMVAWSPGGLLAYEDGWIGT